MSKKISDTPVSISGVAASPGFAFGHAFLWQSLAREKTGKRLASVAEEHAAIHGFDVAVTDALAALQALPAQAKRSLTEDELAIVDTQSELIGDPQLRDDVLEKITIEKMTAGDALLTVIDNLEAQFRQMDNEYMQARAADVRDIGNRIAAKLPGSGVRPGVYTPPRGSILVAEDIPPSDAIAIDPALVAGLATMTGGRTSHTALLARSKGLPAVVGCGNALKTIRAGDFLIVDGTGGRVIVEPTAEVRADYAARNTAWQQHTTALADLKELASETSDGIRIHLQANVSGAAEAAAMLESGGDGVGLFRTELSFMTAVSLPTEEQQFETYRAVALAARGKPVIVRTIDIGGDKPLPYLPIAPEANPFLGYRAIRICLDRKDIFIRQLKAILRAGLSGNLSIMFPMISGLGELRQAKAILQEAKDELTRDGVAFAPQVPVGIMVEIPSAAVTADLLAAEADFFSIGTNDLCQYTLAVDRMNEQISHLYDPFHPGVLRLIAQTIAAGKKNGIPVGLCGDMGSDPAATLLLIGLGLRDLSMPAPAIPVIKRLIRSHSLTEAEAMARHVLTLSTSTEILQYLEPFHQ